MMAAHTPTKAERIEAGRVLAQTATAAAIALVDSGDRAGAETLIVHAYHEGAPALQLVEQYHVQRSAQERARQ